VSFETADVSELFFNADVQERASAFFMRIFYGKNERTFEREMKK